jgi:hypothetical protein
MMTPFVCGIMLACGRSEWSAHCSDYCPPMVCRMGDSRGCWHDGYLVGGGVDAFGDELMGEMSPGFARPLTASACSTQKQQMGGC